MPLEDSRGTTVAVVATGIQSEPLDPEAARTAVADPSCGGQAVFTGLVRDRDGGRDVQRIEYVAHPTAAARLTEVVQETLTGFPAVVRAVAWHRTGVLDVGDIAIVVAVASPHRAEAFAAVAELVERIKATVPIWKRQVFADGTDAWTNTP